MTPGIEISPVLKIALTAEERQSVITMLQANNLPVADINEETLLYILMEGDQHIGTAGLEIYGDCALLRSISIAKEKQRNGYGKVITSGIENYANESGINCMYLLTTTAKDFFEKQGYCIIKREDTPASIKQTAEFTSLCPASAVVMKKRI